MSSDTHTLRTRLAAVEAERDETLELIAQLEKKLGVKGATAVLRKALAMAKAARACVEDTSHAD